MAMGKAVVVNDHPEQSLIIAESKAGLCTPYNEDDFAKAILYLLGHPEKLETMGLLGRKYIEQTKSYNIIANQLEKTLIRQYKRDRQPVDRLLRNVDF